VPAPPPPPLLSLASLAGQSLFESRSMIQLPTSSASLSSRCGWRDGLQRRIHCISSRGQATRGGLPTCRMVTIKNANFWDVEQCPSVRYRLTLLLDRVISSTLKTEATSSSETSVYNKPTRRHFQEDGILHCYENCTKSLGPGRIIWINDLSDRIFFFN
jgi:hypothetical protein